MIVAKEWSHIEVEYHDTQAIDATDKNIKKLLDATDKLGFYHSKPFNTLSNVQFCIDPDYQTSGEYGLLLINYLMQLQKLASVVAPMLTVLFMPV